MLSYTGRRVLGHLPVWAEDEDAHVAAEGGPELSIRSYSTSEMHQRLAEDASTPEMGEPDVEARLQELAEAKLTKQDKDGSWRMTKKGYEVLVAPKQEEDTTVAGPALLDLNPGKALSNARSE